MHKTKTKQVHGANGSGHKEVHQGGGHNMLQGPNVGTEMALAKEVHNDIRRRDNEVVGQHVTESTLAMALGTTTLGNRLEVHNIVGNLSLGVSVSGTNGLGIDVMNGPSSMMGGVKEVMSVLWVRMQLGLGLKRRNKVK